MSLSVSPEHEKYRFRACYYDPLYPYAWVQPRCSQKITGHLCNKGFEHVTAIDLFWWAKDRLREKNVESSVAVFSQDVFPDTVFPVDSPNILIRRYLDAGGKIIWIGDIPFWYRGV